MLARYANSDNKEVGPASWQGLLFFFLDHRYRLSSDSGLACKGHFDRPIDIRLERGSAWLA
jgi:hypothetical protein